MDFTFLHTEKGRKLKNVITVYFEKRKINFFSSVFSISVLFITVIEKPIILISLQNCVPNFQSLSATFTRCQH